MTDDMGLPEKPSGIIFDWDNTLVDSWPTIQAAMNATLRAMDCPEWSMEETKSRVALSMRETFPTLFKDRWEEARDVFYTAFRSFHLDQLREMPGAGELLQTLSDDGICLMVVSNKSGPDLRKEADHLGWTPFFQAIVGAGDAASDKPAIDPGVMVLDAAGLAAGPDVWFVGDAPVDMVLGHALGLTPVLMRTWDPEPGEFDAAPPAFQVATCDDLTALVKCVS